MPPNPQHLKREIRKAVHGAENECAMYERLQEILRGVSGRKFWDTSWSPLDPRTYKITVTFLDVKEGPWVEIRVRLRKPFPKVGLPGAITPGPIAL